MAGLQFVGLMGKGGGGDSGGPSTEWFGTGEDGDVIISTNTDLPVEADIGHIFKQYNSLTINSGVTLKPAARCAGMVITVRGNCTINGVLSMTQMAPRRSEDTENDILDNGPTSKWLQKISSSLGGKGGNGSKAGYGSSSSGTSGLGGNGHRFGGGYGGGGGNIGLSTYKGGDGEPRPPLSITWPYPGSNGSNAQYGAGAGSDGAIGGSAPGGGGAFYNYVSSESLHLRYPGGNGSAYGGGLLILIVGGILRVSSAGKVAADGGKGGTGAAFSSNYSAGGSGGGGGGGIVAIMTFNPPFLGGSVTASGGISTAPAYHAGMKGGNGAIGVTQTLQLLNSGEVTPW